MHPDAHLLNEAALLAHFNAHHVRADGQPPLIPSPVDPDGAYLLRWHDHQHRTGVVGHLHDEML